MRDISRDVVIVGAGAAGTSAAVRLRKGGLSVAVLEARDRVGGRLWNDTTDGVVWEMGGQWASPDQDALLSMLADLGLETFDRYRVGDSVYIGPGGRRARFTGDLLPAPETTRRTMLALTDELDRLAAQIDPNRPWDAPDAARLDRISFETWIREQTDDAEAADNITLFIAAMMLAKPPHTFSMLNALLMAASIGSFSRLVDADYVLDKRVVGGLQLVPVRLAERLGEDLLLGQPVRRLDWREHAVTAYTDTTAVHAHWAILAHAPVLHDRIDFVPPLPRRRQQLHQHLSMGSVIKVQAAYDAPFWRDDGLSGTAFSPYEICHEAYDNTDTGDPRGILVAFVSALNADAMYALPPHTRRQRLLESLSHYFGPRALHPIGYRESDWDAEEWTRGAYDTSFDLGGLTRYGSDLRTPVGPIHFACSDIAGAGYMHVDGAIRMGHGAADSILCEAEDRRYRYPLNDG